MDIRQQLQDAMNDDDELSATDLTAAMYGDLDRIDGGPVQIAITNIVEDDRLQMRLDGLDKKHIAALVASLEDGGTVDDPVVIYQDSGGIHWLADGFHRMEAHRQAGRETILANIHPGEFEDAKVCAEEANLKHGKSLSTASKKAIFDDRVTRGHETNGIGWAKLSDGALASELGVDRKTIANWFDDLATRENSLVIDRAVVYGRDGREYRTKAIAESNQQQAVEALCRDCTWLNEDDLPFDAADVSEARVIIRERLIPYPSPDLQYQYVMAILNYHQNGDGDNLWMRIAEHWFDFYYEGLPLTAIAGELASTIKATRSVTDLPVVDVEEIPPSNPPKALGGSPARWGSGFDRQRAVDGDDEGGPMVPDPGRLQKDNQELAIQRMYEVMRHTAKARENRNVEICQYLNREDREKLVKDLEDTIDWASKLLSQLGVISRVNHMVSLAGHVFDLFYDPQNAWLLNEVADDLEALGYYVDEDLLPTVEGEVE